MTLAALCTLALWQSQAAAPVSKPAATAKPVVEFKGQILESPPVLRTWPAEEAQQGVAVDDTHFFVIGNRIIGKYDRKTGQRVARFESPADGPLIHMNGGFVHEGKLYCSHSNFPGVPMESSIEIFDPATLKHIGSHSFGPGMGSLVWLDWHDGHWWVAFGHYSGRGGEPGMANDRSTLVKMDKDFRRIAAYTFPKEFIARWEGMTASGGFFGPDGLIYATGHHMPEIYVMALPTAGSTLVPLRIIKSPVEGQGLALDHKTGEVYQMQRKEKKIYVLKVF